MRTDSATLAISVWRTPLDKTILYLPCERLGTPEAAAQNSRGLPGALLHGIELRSAQRIDETDLFRRQAMMPSETLRQA